MALTMCCCSWLQSFGIPVEVQQLKIFPSRNVPCSHLKQMKHCTYSMTWEQFWGLWVSTVHLQRGQNILNISIDNHIPSIRLASLREAKEGRREEGGCPQLPWSLHLAIPRPQSNWFDSYIKDSKLPDLELTDPSPPPTEYSISYMLDKPLSCRVIYSFLQRQGSAMFIYKVVVIFFFTWISLCISASFLPNAAHLEELKKW